MLGFPYFGGMFPFVISREYSENCLKLLHITQIVAQNISKMWKLFGSWERSTLSETKRNLFCVFVMMRMLSLNLFITSLRLPSRYPSENLRVQSSLHEKHNILLRPLIMCTWNINLILVLSLEKNFSFFLSPQTM